MPRNKLVLEQCDYRVKPDTPVTVTISTGNGQVSGTKGKFENQIIDIPEAQPTPVGSQGQNLVGLSLNTISVVKDIAANHNRTSITIKLEGGVATENCVFDADAYNDQGLVIYDVLIKFI